MALFDKDSLPQVCSIYRPAQDIEPGELAVPEPKYEILIGSVPIWAEPLNPYDMLDFIGFVTEFPHRLWIPVEYAAYVGVSYKFLLTDNTVFLQIGKASVYDEGVDDHIEIPAKKL